MSAAKDGRLSYVLKQNIEIVVLVIAAVVLYLAFMSRSFDEGDAFNFALALSRYDVSAHRPHPPGYPVFVLISSILYRITNDPLLSLTSVSALAGALTLIPTYAIAKRLFNREIAFLSALTLMVVPGFWLVSEQAVSDSLFILFLTLALSQLLAGRQSKPHLYASWGTLGIALGVRPLNFVFIAPFLFQTAKAGKHRDAFYCAMILLCTFLLAFLPAILLTGYNQYLDSVLDQLTRHLRDDVNPFGFSAIDRLVFLLLTLANTLGASLPFRVLPFYPFMSDSLCAQLNSILILVLSGTALILLRHVKDLSRALFVVLWVVPYFVFVYLLGAPGYSRYMLPILPPVLIILVASALRAGRFLGSSTGSSKGIVTHLKTMARYVIVLVFVTSMFAYSLPLAAIIHSQPAPNVQLVAFVRSNYDPSTTTIIVFHEFRAFQFYGGEFRHVHCWHDIQKALAIIESSHSSDSVLITDSALQVLRKERITLTVLKVMEFFRDPLVNVEDHRVILYRVLAISFDVREQRGSAVKELNQRG